MATDASNTDVAVTGESTYQLRGITSMVMGLLVLAVGVSMLGALAPAQGQGPGAGYRAGQFLMGVGGILMALGLFRITRTMRGCILMLVFLAITINYVDRQVINVLGSDLKRIFHIGNDAWGYIGSAFSIAYALGQLGCGWLLDRFGVRVGYTVSLLAWSLVSMVTAAVGALPLAWAAWGFGSVRGVLGVAESPAYPAAAKTLAEWFPKRERALAFGFVNAGGNMGAILAPAVVPFLAGKDAVHWEWAFIVTGGLGLLWLFLWVPFYRRPEDHPRLNPQEFKLIRSDPPEPTGKIRWLTLMTFPQAWAFAIAKFFTDAMWWFYLIWFPIYLHDKYKLDLQTMGPPLIIIFVLSDLGSICGGWMSSGMMKAGASVNVARKTAMFVAALGVLPMGMMGVLPLLGSTRADNLGLWTAVLLLGLALAAHQAFSSNLYTTVSDTFPRRAVASVAGFGGMFGYLGSAIFQPIVGNLYKTEKPHLIAIPFIVAALAYLLSWCIVQALAPRLEPANVGQEANA